MDNVTSTRVPQRESAGARTEDRSTSGLLSTLAGDVSDLMRGELHLARAEIKQSIGDVKKGLVSMGAGIAVLLAGVLTLIAFVVLGLADWLEWSLWLSALVVGLIATVAGGLMLKAGGSTLSADSLAPDRTLSSLEKDRKLVEKKLS